MPNKIADEVESRVSIDGHSMTTATLNGIVQPLFASVHLQISKVLQDVNLLKSGEATAISDKNGNDVNDIQNVIWHTWGGGMHPVPKGYRIRTYSAFDHWNLWHFGNPSDRIAPHKYILILICALPKV